MIRLWNPAAAELTGLEAQAVVGLTIPGALPGWPDAKQGGRPTVPVKVNGRELWLSVSASRLRRRDRVRVPRPHRRPNARAAEERLMSTVSHELRTPLAAIYGAAMTVRRGVRGSRATREMLLDVISPERSGSRGRSTTCSGPAGSSPGDSTSRSRAATPPSCSKVSSRPPGRTCRRTSSSSSRTNGRLKVAADPPESGQVLSNLLDNAVKYSPDGGVIRLSVEGIGGKVRFVVRDEGSGSRPASAGDLQEVLSPRSEPEPRRRWHGARPLHMSASSSTGWGAGLSVSANGDRGSMVRVELPTA